MESSTRYRRRNRTPPMPSISATLKKGHQRHQCYHSRSHRCKPKTWAQVAAGVGNTDIHLEIAINESLKNFKREREKTELAPSLHTASDENAEHAVRIEEKCDY